MYVLIEVYQGVVNEVWLFEDEDLAETFKNKLSEATKPKFPKQSNCSGCSDDFDYVIMLSNVITLREFIAEII